MLNVLVLCDDCWHPAETVQRSLNLLSKEAFCFDYVCAPRDILSNEMIRRYDVIVLARGNSFSAALKDNVWFDPKWCAVMPQDFKRYIEEGRGFLSLHAGNCYRKGDCPEMVALIGNDFQFHPPQCPVTVRATKPHPITQGVQSFIARDEHYVIDLVADDADVFLESVSDTPADTQPAGYTRQIGKGRLCVLTPGHTLSALSNPEYLKMIANALKWCAGE
ncbi:MAG: ThuA domain-containing protein [Clostridia bacterium]|nr:ThuA domain-containing protein [Clostridia bacterium]